MLRLNKTISRKTTLHADQDVDDVLFWLTKTPDERMAAIESIRQQTFAFNSPTVNEGQPAQPRLQRVCRIIKRL